MVVHGHPLLLDRQRPQNYVMYLLALPHSRLSKESSVTGDKWAGESTFQPLGDGAHTEVTLLSHLGSTFLVQPESRRAQRHPRRATRYPTGGRDSAARDDLDPQPVGVVQVRGVVAAAVPGALAGRRRRQGVASAVGHPGRVLHQLRDVIEQSGPWRHC